MGLQVWLPLNGNLDNQGLADVSVTSGTAKYKIGKIGNGLDLSSKIMFSCPKLVGLKQFTIMFWVKIEDDDSITSNWQDIFGTYEQKSDDSSHGNFRAETCYAMESDSRLGVHWHDSTNYGITSGTLPTHYMGDRGIWHHCAIVVDSDQFIKSYTDGVLKNEYTTGLNGGHLYNGVFWLGETNNIVGCVNDVRIYDNCLSPREIKEISKGLVLHYPLAMPGQENLITNSVERIINLSETNNNNYLTIVTGLTIGETYTFSAVVELEGTDNKKCTIYNYKSNESTTGRPIIKNFIADGITRDSWTFTAVNSAVIVYAGVNGSTKGIKAIYKYAKLERGSRSTPWIPNPADAEYSALGFDDGIEYDVSGYGHNGTKVGTITYDADTPRYATSTKFNGSQYIQLPFPCGMISEAVTVACWGYESNWNTTTAERLIGAARSSSGWCIGDYGSENTLFAFYADGSYNSASGFKQLSDGWHHFVITFDGINLKYYVDGVLFSSKTFSAKQSVTGVYNIQIGQHYGGTCNFRGNMSDVRIYATALSADDILELYHTPETVSHNGTLLTQGEFVES